MVEMGGIEPPSNKPLLSRSFRKPKFAHNNVEHFNTMKDLTSSDSSIAADGRRSVNQSIRLTARSGEIFRATGLDLY
jgi:hypothetical protein